MSSYPASNLKLSLTPLARARKEFRDPSTSEYRDDQASPEVSRKLISNLQSNMEALRSSVSVLKFKMISKAAPTSQPQQTQPKVIDYRRPQTKSKAAITEIKVEKPISSTHSMPHPKGLYSSYGRGQDPPPHLGGTFMQKSTAPQEFSDPLRKHYEDKYLKYLSEKDRLAKLSLEPPKKPEYPKHFQEPEVALKLRQIFRAIDKENIGKVGKMQLVAEFSENEELLDLFGLFDFLDNHSYMAKVTDILENIGANPWLTEEEFLTFFQVHQNVLLKSKPVKEAASAEKDEKPNEQKPRTRLVRRKKTKVTMAVVLHKEVLEYLQGLWESIEIEHPTRSDFYECVLADPEISSLLDNTPVVEWSDGYVVMLDKFLSQFVSEGSEMIWEDFLAKLSGPEDDPRLDELQVPEDFFTLIKEVFESLKQIREGQVSTEAFCEAIRAEAQSILEEPARDPKGISVIPAETVGEVLDRLERDAAILVDLEDVLGYFTLRGVRKDAEDSSDDEIIEEVIEDPASKQTSPPRPNLSITVPEPFSFDRRERVKTKSIRQQTLERILAEDEAKIREVMSFRFQANPVPAETKLNLYEQIMKEQNDRRLERVQTLRAISQANTNPFSFYYRDLNKQRPKPVEPPQRIFKANQVPWETKVQIYHQMVTQDAMSRKERLQQAALRSLKRSHLPPRMAMHQAAVGQRVASTKARPRREYQKNKYRARSVPNFKYLQESFKAKLNAVKQARPKTALEPFNLTNKPYKYCDSVHMRAIDELLYPEPKPLPSLDVRKPKDLNTPTEKWKSWVALKALQRAEKEKQAMAELAEAEKRKNKLKYVKQQVHSCRAIRDNIQSLRQRQQQFLEDRKLQVLEKEHAYAQQRAEIDARVRDRPLLVETVVSGSREMNEEDLYIEDMEYQPDSIEEEEYSSEMLDRQHSF